MLQKSVNLRKTCFIQIEGKGTVYRYGIINCV